jgi:hypothetical protein
MGCSRMAGPGWTCLAGGIVTYRDDDIHARRVKKLTSPVIVYTRRRNMARRDSCAKAANAATMLFAPLIRQ